MSSGSRPPRDSTAAHPATPAATIAALPTGTRRRSSEPATAAMTAMTASTSTDSASLSAVPNVVIAHSFTGPGVRSMTDDPIAVRESDCGPNECGDKLGDAEGDCRGRDARHRPCPARRHAGQGTDLHTRKPYR